jgi:hypothetical protein
MGDFLQRVVFWVLALLLLSPGLQAAETERLFLSGTGVGNTIDWEFRCTAGRGCGQWTTIPVPSQWEQEGFGEYNYGHDENKHRDCGQYRYRFQAPEEWGGRRVEIVFDGVMTDAEVTLNGQLVGPPHQGGFYRFRYDVSELLRFGPVSGFVPVPGSVPGSGNLLEVLVCEASSDRRVNDAERDADYWVFGGIYRPVFLEARPAEAVVHLALDARHDGTLSVFASLGGVEAPAQLVAWVETLEGTMVGQSIRGAVVAGEEVRLQGHFKGVKPWSAEAPYLYLLQVELRRGELVLHRERQRFGFRTVELRAGEGLFVNGHRIRLKGVNRHAFHPASGRTSNRALDRRDVELIKELNMNAVRASHYPPDESFLDACDELGLYVLNELAGWHDAYGTEVGKRLVAETVRRDVNHPSILFWDNGNEGGWNTALDSEFALHDPQRRVVLHPDENFGGFDTQHYLTWEELEASLDPTTLKNRWRAFFDPLPLVMPTELLHGLYDGGSGAGLEDYWNRLRTSPRGAGLFLWSFTDESVERTDRGGALDSDGNHAPDGILGPYRELTGNYHAARAIFSPVWFDLEPGAILREPLRVENRFDATDLSQCRFRWRGMHLPKVGEPLVAVAVKEGEFPGPSAPPGGSAVLPLPFLAALDGLDALELTVHDPQGRAVQTWSWLLRDLRQELVEKARRGRKPLELKEIGEAWVMRAGDMRVEIDHESGELRSLSRSGTRFPFAQGPRFLGAEDGRSFEVQGREEPGRLEVVARRNGSARSLRWELFPSGWLRLSFAYEFERTRAYHGIGFDLQAEAMENFLWLGRGPARQWKNRQRGGTLGVWGKDVSELEMPGYYGNVLWAEVWTPAGTLEIAFEKPGLYLGVLTPRFPDDAQDARAEVPAADLAFLAGIPAIGTKFSPAQDLGPQGQEHPPASHRGAVWLRFQPREEN